MAAMIGKRVPRASGPTSVSTHAAMTLEQEVWLRAVDAHAVLYATASISPSVEDFAHGVLESFRKEFLND